MANITLNEVEKRILVGRIMISKLATTSDIDVKLDDFKVYNDIYLIITV